MSLDVYLMYTFVYTFCGQKGTMCSEMLRSTVNPSILKGFSLYVVICIPCILCIPIILDRENIIERNEERNEKLEWNHRA